MKSPLMALVLAVLNASRSFSISFFDFEFSVGFECDVIPAVYLFFLRLNINKNQKT
jgi:hypothetical protein